MNTHTQVSSIHPSRMKIDMKTFMLQQAADIAIFLVINEIEVEEVALKLLLCVENYLIGLRKVV